MKNARAVVEAFQGLPTLVNTSVNLLQKSLKWVVLSSRIVSLSVLGEAVIRELKGDGQIDNCQPCLDRDDDVTSAPDPLSNPQSRRTTS